MQAPATKAVIHNCSHCRPRRRRRSPPPLHVSIALNLETTVVVVTVVAALAFFWCYGTDAALAGK